MNITIGRLSEQTGVKVETIRYYEKIGLMPSPERTASGHRIYDQTQLMRLTSIKRCRDLGFPLDDVRMMLGLIDGGYTCGEVRDLTLQHQASIKQKITDLKRLDKTLGTLATACRGGSSKECAVVDALFEGSIERSKGMPQ